MKIALGSENPAKIAAVRAAAARIATVAHAWRDAEIIARAVRVSVPAMPLSDDQLMRGARERATCLQAENIDAQLFIGLEGGFHTVLTDGLRVTFLRGWAYATDSVNGYWGAAPAVTVPGYIVRRVTESGRELAAVIDEVAGENDIRSRQGAWGVLSRDLLTRAESFETALLAACAPFYNPKFYEQF